MKATLPFVGTMTVSGTDGDGDGVITLVGGVVAGALFLIIMFSNITPKTERIFSIVALLIFAGIVLIAFIDWMDIRDRIAGLDSEFRSLASVGWGLYLTGGAGLAGAVFTVRSLQNLNAREPTEQDQ